MDIACRSKKEAKIKITGSWHAYETLMNVSEFVERKEAVKKTTRDRQASNSIFFLSSVENSHLRSCVLMHETFW